MPAAIRKVESTEMAAMAQVAPATEAGRAGSTSTRVTSSTTATGQSSSRLSTPRQPVKRSRSAVVACGISRLTSTSYRAHAHAEAHSSSTCSGSDVVCVAAPLEGCSPLLSSATMVATPASVTATEHPLMGSKLSPRINTENIATHSVVLW
eukprot:3646216-Prymnesium_polylepis.1